MVEDRIDVGALGARLRELRRAARHSVAALAERSGVSRSMISEVERGGRVPTILTLDRLATALGTSIARLTAPEHPHETQVLRRDAQTVLREADWHRRILSPVLPGVEFEFMRAELEPGCDAGTYDPHPPGSREYIAIETGSLTLTLRDSTHRLDAGDAIFFPGDQPHSFRNDGTAACTYYLVMDLGSHDDPGDHHQEEPA